MQVSPETKVSAAVVVAAGLFERAKLLGSSANAWKLAKLAADVIDRTRPHPVLHIAYKDKPQAQSDTEFLAANLKFLDALPPADWPPRKVRSPEWGEFTRVVHGLEELFGAKVLNVKEGLRNRAALVAFTERYASVLADDERAQLSTALTKDAPLEH